MHKNTTGALFFVYIVVTWMFIIYDRHKIILYYFLSDSCTGNKNASYLLRFYRKPLSKFI